MNWNARQIPGPLESDVPAYDPDACTECGEVDGCNCDRAEGDEEDEDGED